MTSQERFAANLRQARTKAGISQEELGNRCELHRTEISLLERAGREPRLGTIVKLAGALGTTVGDLAGGIAWEPSKRRFEVKAAGKAGG
jgi:transcriptional regulator with XRE-family HTH domain